MDIKLRLYMIPFFITFFDNVPSTYIASQSVIQRFSHLGSLPFMISVAFAALRTAHNRPIHGPKNSPDHQ